MKRIALDIETTGLNPTQGHRIVEIGCVELENNYPTGNYFQQYINPNRKMPEEAFKIHGLTDEFLLDKPTFLLVADKFLDFIKGSELVIHNAKFDLGFLNYELELASKKPLLEFKVVDTLVEARKIFPGAANNLDSLCRRYDIDVGKRKKHGALLDAELLADVFLEMNGGRQQNMGLEPKKNNVKEKVMLNKEFLYSKKIIMPDSKEMQSHEEILKSLKKNYW
ncbi:MAG: DNA polymerase III subunit epsilon [Pelagibacterales bacterium]|nr:DNA polymerase III subunit epsilon [Pelagibacterales bacterium]|tara:strand:- start:5091 stop:5759 length:669 start_codon:yes stop_codon:yes gene_type:complete